MGRRLALSLVLTLLAGGLAVLALAGSGEPQGPRPRVARGAPAPAPTPAAAPAAGSTAAFAVLVNQSSNRCDLQAREIMAYAAGRRLQGSCCSRMDEGTYRAQVDALRSYRATRQIPRDPYDIAAGLAQQLLRYDQRIRLDAGDRATYRRAMSMSRLQGPCCCRCWRWSAFRGLSRYLISQRGWRPPELARLIDALDGCGGQHPATGPGPPGTPS